MQYATWEMIQQLNAALRIGRLTDLGYIPCPLCQELIPPGAITCPYCGVGTGTRHSWRMTEVVEEVTVTGAASSTLAGRPSAGRKGKAVA